MCSILLFQNRFYFRDPVNKIMNQTSSFLVFNTKINMTFCVDKYRRCRDPFVSIFTLAVLFGKSEGKAFVGNASEEEEEDSVKLVASKIQYDNRYQVYSLLECDAT